MVHLKFLKLLMKILIVVLVLGTVWMGSTFSCLLTEEENLYLQYLKLIKTKKIDKIKTKWNEKFKDIELNLGYSKIMSYGMRTLNLEIEEFLINQGFIEMMDQDNNRPIHLAVLDNQLETVQLLIKYKCYLNVSNKKKHSPLHIAVISNFIPIVNCLIKAKCNLDLPDEDGKAPIHWAAIFNYVDVLDLLISAKCKLNIVDKLEYTPIQNAVLKNNVESVEHLIKSNCKLDQKMVDGGSLLLEAISNDFILIAKHLINARCDVNAKNKLDYRPIHIAVIQNNIDMVNLLISAGCNVNVVINRGYNPVHIAVSLDSVEMTDILIKASCDIEVEDRNGQRPIHFAAIRSYLKVMDLLIEAGCNVDAVDNNGSTPIIYSTVKNDIDGVKKLIKAGCDVDVRDKSGERPIDLAQHHCLTEIIEILSKTEPKENYKEKKRERHISIRDINDIHKLVVKDEDIWYASQLTDFGSWGEFKLKLAEKLKRNKADIDFIDSLNMKIIKDEERIRTWSDIIYIFRTNNYKFHDFILNGVFSCTNTVTKEKFYIKQLEGLRMLREIVKLKHAKLSNFVDISEILCDGENIYILWNYFDWNLIIDYTNNSDPNSYQKFLTTQILHESKELQNENINLTIDIKYIFMTNNNSCIFVPSAIYTGDNLGLIQSKIFQSSILYSCSRKRQNNITGLMSLDECLDSDLLKDDVTVTFRSNEADPNAPPILTVTYFARALTIKKLKDTILCTFPNKCREDIFIVVSNKFMYYKDEHILEMNDSISITFAEITQNENIKIEYHPSSNMFKGIKNGIKIGEGAFGQVYKYESNFSRDPVAIKYFRALLCGKQDSKFLTVLKEVSILLELDHPNIVKFKEFNRAKYEDLMIVMEYLEGGSLNNYIKAKGRLPDRELKYFLKQILQGLHYLHSCRIMHLDIKCDNILINGSYTVCKLADFGISRKLKEGMTFATECVTSTRNFISPELLAGTSRQYDTKTDIWSLGGAIVEMATGKMPFDALIGNIITEMIYKNKKMKYCNEYVPEEIQELISICTRSVAQERPSAEELLNHSILMD